MAIPDIADSDHHWVVKWGAAPAAVHLAADISPVVDTHPVVEAVPADNAAVALQASAVAVPVDIVEIVLADIDRASFAKALLDFENFPARACPAAANLAELALWDRIDYDIDLAWSILFCIHAINKKRSNLTYAYTLATLLPL